MVDLPEFREEEHNRAARRAAVEPGMRFCPAKKHTQPCQLPYGHEGGHVYEIKGVTRTDGAPRDPSTGQDW